MKITDVNIRDPYILCTKGRYYLYGTRSATTWGPADGFDCYRSEDMENWEGPIEIFHKSEDFFADRSYWAPECYEMDGCYYLLTTLGCETRKKGIYALKSDSPEGPFQSYSEELTPADWTSIDGTLYMKNGRVFMVFSHSFEDTPDGDMCMIELSPDLHHAITEPITLFSAPDAPWAQPVPFAEAEFGMKGDVYFTDGPCVFDGPDDGLYMLWSSWSKCGYAIGTAVSETGEITGPWKQLPDPVFPENGGHGMAFRKLNGELSYTLHFPNDLFKERPIFRKLVVEDGIIKLAE